MRLFNQAKAFISYLRASLQLSFASGKSQYINQYLIVFLVFLLISGCQSQKFLIHKKEFNTLNIPFLDEAFTNADTYSIESPQSLFELSAEAEAFARAAVSGKDSEEKQVRSLMAAIFDRSEFDLLYQADANTNASATFENRAANCLSLTIMTYAMARHVGFNARFQKIDIPEFWTRKAGFSLLNGHINLRIMPKYKVRTLELFSRDLVIDFDPQDDSHKFKAEVLDKNRIVAMFYNNKAAELILKNELHHAYAYLRAALKIDPYYEGAMLNLGLIYRKTDQLEEAEQLYLAALALDEKYWTAWENLAALYELTQRVEQAQNIYARIQRQRATNPYFHLMLAEESLDKQEYESSIRHYKDAIELDDNPHQFYFGLAKAYSYLGDVKSTERYLKIAKRKAGKARIAESYGKKIAMLSRQES